MGNAMKNLIIDLKDADKNEVFQSIFKLSSDGIFILNHKDEITAANQAAEEMFNYEHGELIGKKLRDFVLNVSGAANQNIESIVSSFTENSVHEIRVIGNNDIFYPAELAISRIHLSEATWTVCAIKNIFHRKRCELFSTVIRELTHVDRVEIAIPKILRVICETMLLEIGGLWVVDESILKCVALFSRHDEKKEIIEFINAYKKYTFDVGEGLSGRVWRDKSAIWVKDIGADSNFPLASAALKIDLHSALAFPVIFNNKFIGVLEFFMHHSYRFNDQWMQMLNDTSNQIGIFFERERAWKILMDMQRQAGMAEVAASVLHNIGNVLNSVGVSISSLNDSINTVAFDNASKILGFLKENSTRLQEYLSQDARGKLLPNYFIQLLAELELAHDVLKKESKNISTHFNHINEIVSSQGAISGCKSGKIEKVFLPDVVDMALQLSSHALAAKNIRLDRPITDPIFATADKSRIVQIIVNFVQNAKDSLVSNNVDRLKIITIGITENKTENCAEISVKDNGIGISKANLNKLFAFGFTTKSQGHGFGLYNSFLSAKELGGTIIVESEGEGSGATFILKLPRIGEIHE